MTQVSGVGCKSPRSVLEAIIGLSTPHQNGALQLRATYGNGYGPRKLSRTNVGRAARKLYSSMRRDIVEFLHTLSRLPSHDRLLSAVMTSPLFDTHRIATNLERAYEVMWEVKIMGLSPQHLGGNNIQRLAIFT